MIANMFTNFPAIIHSRNAVDQVDTVHKLDGENKYAARYHKKWYSAIYNLFSGFFYVDDKYGEFPEDDAERFEVAYAALNDE